MRSFHMPYAFERMQLEASLHWIGDLGGNEYVAFRRIEKRRKKKRRLMVVPI